MPSTFQTPGADIAANLASFRNLEVISGDGADPQGAAELIARAVGFVREQRKPALLAALTVPRLEGHSFQDNADLLQGRSVVGTRNGSRDPAARSCGTIRRRRS